MTRKQKAGRTRIEGVLVLAARHIYVPFLLRRLLVRIFSPKVAVGVLALIRRKDELLLVRQAYSRERFWRLPGGVLDRREDPVAGIERELAEELGLRVTGLELRSASLDPSFGGLIILYACEPANDVTLELGDEVADARFFSCSRLPALYPSHEALIRGHLT